MIQYKFIPFWFFLMVFSTLSCKKDAVGPGFEMLYRRDFEIQAGLSPFVVHHYYLNNLSSSYISSLTAQGMTNESIKKVNNITGELSAIFGDEKLDFISRISVRVYKEGKQNEYTEIAYRDPAPISIGATLGLVPSLANVKETMQESRFGIDVAIETRYITTATVPVRLDLKMRAEQ
jgi:hypothetical protein